MAVVALAAPHSFLTWCVCVGIDSVAGPPRRSGREAARPAGALFVPEKGVRTERAHERPARKRERRGAHGNRRLPPLARNVSSPRSRSAFDARAVRGCGRSEVPARGATLTRSSRPRRRPISGSRPGPLARFSESSSSAQLAGAEHRRGAARASHRGLVRGPVQVLEAASRLRTVAASPAPSRCRPPTCRRVAPPEAAGPCGRNGMADEATLLSSPAQSSASATCTAEHAIRCSLHATQRSLFGAAASASLRPRREPSITRSHRRGTSAREEVRRCRRSAERRVWSSRPCRCSRRSSCWSGHHRRMRG